MPFRLSAEVGTPRADCADANDPAAEHDVVFRVELLMATLVSEEIPVNDEGETSQRDQPAPPPPQVEPRRHDGAKRTPRRRASSGDEDKREDGDEDAGEGEDEGARRGARHDEHAHGKGDQDEASVGAMGCGGHKGSLGARRRADKRVRGYGDGQDDDAR